MGRIQYSCRSCRRNLSLNNVVLPLFCSCGTQIDTPNIHVDVQRMAKNDVVTFGVGDAIAEILGELAIEEKAGCNCKTLRQILNAWNIDGCRRNEQWIVEQLERNAATWSVAEKAFIAIRNVSNPIVRAAAFGANFYKTVLYEAIHRVEKRNESKRFRLCVPSYAKLAVGVFAAVHNVIGGTETYWQMLHSQIGVAGLVTPQLPKQTAAAFWVGWGDVSIKELCSSVDALIVWGITDADEQTRGPRRIAIHHGSLQSTWANSVFENQLQWCEDAIAINAEVAEKYGVKYLPNAVDKSRIVGEPYDKTDRVVFWNHREALEKRPWLVRRIAERLPDGWVLVATLPIERSSPKLRCVGQIDHPGRWLSTADVFLSTASQEGFGFSVAEAFAAGVPVVSSRCGIANDEVAEIVDSENVDEWVAAILRAGRKVELAKQWVEANCSVETWTNHWSSMLAKSS